MLLLNTVENAIKMQPYAHTIMYTHSHYSSQCTPKSGADPGG